VTDCSGSLRDPVAEGERELDRVLIDAAHWSMTAAMAKLLGATLRQRQGGGSTMPSFNSRAEAEPLRRAFRHLVLMRARLELDRAARRRPPTWRSATWPPSRSKTASSG
jgi:hypothetical protein